jgi:PAS domain S-box-containing protein
MATFDWDIVKNKRTWSDGVHSLLGTKPEAFTGTAEEFFKTIHPADRSAVQAALVRAVETTGEYETEYRAVWPDGSIHHIGARGKVHRDNADKAVRMTGVCWDITERKRAEEALRQKDTELQRAQRVAHIGSWYWDAKTDATTGSDELLRIYGFDPARQSMPDFKAQRGQCYPVEDWERVNAAVQRTVLTGIGYELDARVVHDGATIWVTTRGEAVRDAAGAIVGLRGTVQDITARKQTEEALRASNQELTLFNEAMVGRELRMIELKKEINALCARLGQPSRY